MTNDLRIADAPLLVDVSGEEKIPTGGYGNYSTTINQIADFTQLKWKLATEGYVDDEINKTKNLLETHSKDDKNPHNVKKEQIGLSEVDNTADIDKPVSTYQKLEIDKKVAKTSIVDNLTTNETSKVLSAKQGKILQDTKANKSEVYTKDETLTLEREDQYVITESGRTQREKNKDNINILDFGAVLYGLGDSTKAVQQAIDYAVSLATDQCQKTVIIDIPIFVSKQYSTANGWGHCVKIPSNVNIKGSGWVYTSHNYDNRCVVFLTSGSNIQVEGLTGKNIHSGTGACYDIFVGGGTLYDDSLESNATYKNITAYNILGINSWLTTSWQMTSSDDGTIIFEDLNTLFCRSIAKEGNKSSGNFNYRSDPPHKLKNCKMSNVTAKNGATASSFNFVGVDGGSLSVADSELNLYGACEIENGCRGIQISNLRSKNDAYCLWIDDSSEVTFDGLFMENTIETLVTPLLGTLTLNRPILWLTRGGYTDNPTQETTAIIGSNITGINTRIYSSNYGTDLGATFGDISLNNIHIQNDGLNRTDANVPIAFINTFKNISLSNVVVRGSATDAREMVLSASESIVLNNIKYYPKSNTTPLASDFSGTASLAIDDTRLFGINSVPTGYIRYNGLFLNNVRQPVRYGGFRAYYDYTGSPEGVLTANLGAMCHRIDDPAIYLKTTSSGNTGWRRVSLA